jgi:formylglycine-generating enzyme required for sulfatase activity
MPAAGRAITNSIGMKLVLIPPGEFEMGSTKEFIESELSCPAGRLLNDVTYGTAIAREVPRHKVRITKPFWLGAMEVTQEEFERVVGVNQSLFLGNPKLPVEEVSWYDAVDFCRKLSELPAEKAANRHYQLPTEAQWEYACRAGNEGAWCFSRHQGAMAAPEDCKLLGKYAWFEENSGFVTHAVGQKKPNAWGLFDMYGNVSEWCQDYYAEYSNSPAADPVGPSKDDPRVVVGHRVTRGGVFCGGDYWCRSAMRGLGDPKFRGCDIGFRVAAVAAQVRGTQPSEENGAPRTK